MSNSIEKYWLINHDADTNETGMCVNKTYIKTIWQGFPAQQGDHEDEILDDFCYERFGERTAWVQGVAPCENWHKRQITEEQFKEAKPRMWGGSPTETTIIEMGVGNRGNISIIKLRKLDAFR